MPDIFSLIVPGIFHGKYKNIQIKNQPLISLTFSLPLLDYGNWESRSVFHQLFRYPKTKFHQTSTYDYTTLFDVNFTGSLVRGFVQRLGQTRHMNSSEEPSNSKSETLFHYACLSDFLILGSNLAPHKKWSFPLRISSVNGHSFLCMVWDSKGFYNVLKLQDFLQVVSFVNETTCRCLCEQFFPRAARFWNYLPAKCFTLI